MIRPGDLIALAKAGGIAVEAGDAFYLEFLAFRLLHFDRGADVTSEERKRLATVIEHIGTLQASLQKDIGTSAALQSIQGAFDAGSCEGNFARLLRDLHRLQLISETLLDGVRVRPGRQSEEPLSEELWPLLRFFAARGGNIALPSNGDDHEVAEKKPFILFVRTFVQTVLHNAKRLNKRGEQWDLSRLEMIRRKSTSAMVRLLRRLRTLHLETVKLGLVNGTELSPMLDDPDFIPSQLYRPLADSIREMELADASDNSTSR